MLNEIFKDIENYEGLYQVSNKELERFDVIRLVKQTYGDKKWGTD